MQVIDSVSAWSKALSGERFAGRSIGLVPTMGALHPGHGSLIERAAAECSVVGVTIFVNPLQFGASEDLSTYPRPLADDIAFAESLGASYVLAPPVAEMFPQPPEVVVSAGPIASRWEGASRPGHFDGVATIVTKLFAQAGECRAYFGEKDYQQLCVIKKLVVDLNFPVAVVGCPTVREPDGLALSSRNVYLDAAERAAAPVLHRALCAALSSADPVATMHEVVASQPLAELVYAAMVDVDSLQPVDTLDSHTRLLIAARFGQTRLIDNMGVTP